MSIQNQRLRTIDIADPALQKNLEFILDIFSVEASLKFDWKFLIFSTPAAVTNLLIPHNANFVPTDIISTRNEGGITFNYGQFSDKFLSVTTSGAATFRGLIGRYRENQE